MKITKTQLKEIIKEEVTKLKKITILENRKKDIIREMRMLNEESLDETFLQRLANWGKRAVVSVKGALRGGESKSEIFKQAFDEMGWTVGEWMYSIEGDEAVRVKLNSISYNVSNPDINVSIQRKGITGKWVDNTKEEDRMEENFAKSMTKLAEAEGLEQESEWYKEEISRNSIADMIADGTVVFSEDDLNLDNMSMATL